MANNYHDKFGPRFGPAWRSTAVSLGSKHLKTGAACAAICSYTNTLVLKLSQLLNLTVSSSQHHLVWDVMKDFSIEENL